MTDTATALAALGLAALTLSTAFHGIWGRFSPFHRGYRAGVRVVRWHHLFRFLTLTVTAPLWLPFRWLPTRYAVAVLAVAALAVWICFGDSLWDVFGQHSSTRSRGLSE